MRSLYILSGPVHSGKTTKLSDWLKKKKNVAGVLAPVIDEKRFLLNIKTGEKKKLELKNERDKSMIIKVGKYKLDKNILEWGNKIIFKSINENPGWLIIDEFGPLEMKGEGIEPAVKKVIEKDDLLKNTKVIIVMRDSLVLDFIHKYNFTQIDLRWFFFE